MLTSSLLFGAAPALNIQPVHDSAEERETARQLEDLLSTYDVESWTWTKEIRIDKDSIPYSHPILTISSRHRGQKMQLLSTFIHEQYHWFETAHPDRVVPAIAALKRAFPAMPVGTPDGSSDEESTYLHIIVCHAEYQKMIALVGARVARETMEFWAGDHYRAIYRLILDQNQAVGEIVQRYNLLPPL